MNTHLFKQNDETIIQVTFTEGMSSQEIADAYLDSVQMVCARPDTRPVFRIFDVSQAGSHSKTIANAIAEMTQGLVASTVYPQSNMIIVAQPSFANPTSIPLFHSIEAALAFIASKHFPSAA